MMKRRLLAALAAVTLALSAVLLAGCAANKDSGIAIPDAADLFYVYDDAHVLDAETKNYIVTQNDALFALTGAQVVVACVKTTGTTDTGDYAYLLFNKWGIGSVERNNGILVLLSVDDDDYWTMQGEGLTATLPNDVIKAMHNEHLEPEFAVKQYSAGVRRYFDALVSHLEEAYAVDLDTWNGTKGNYTTAAGAEPAPASSGNTVRVLIGVIAGVIVILVIVMIVSNIGGSSRGGRGGKRRRPSPSAVTVSRPVARGGYYPNPRPTVRPPSRPTGSAPRVDGYRGNGTVHK